MVDTLSDTRRHILLAGGGHAHAVALRLLASKPPSPNIRLTLVSPSPHNLYSGALPGVIAGHWPVDAIAVPLQPLCIATGANFIEDRVEAISPDARIAHLASGKELRFDLMSLDVGSGIRDLNISGGENKIVPIRPIAPFLERWDSLLSSIETAKPQQAILVIGAGLAGIEVSLALIHRLKSKGASSPQVCLVDTAPTIASESAHALRRKLSRALQIAGISYLLQTRITNISGDTVTLSSGETLQAVFIVNCTGSAPHDWVGQTGLKTIKGRVEVDECLRSTSHPHIWAAGDTACFKPKPLAPAGVFAVRAGPVIAENIRRYSWNKEPYAFRPQSDYLKLVSLGKRRAIAEKFGITLEGGWVWNLKKSIDFSFLRQHSLPPGD
ncbi:MAG: FAD-dependent oxidoreductase [Hyphomonas sp.]